MKSCPHISLLLLYWKILRSLGDFLPSLACLWLRVCVCPSRYELLCTLLCHLSIGGLQSKRPLIVEITMTVRYVEQTQDFILSDQQSFINAARPYRCQIRSHNSHLSVRWLHHPLSMIQPFTAQWRIVYHLCEWFIYPRSTVHCLRFLNVGYWFMYIGQLVQSAVLR